MTTAPLNTPRSQRRPDLPIVFPFEDMVYFPDGCDGYGFTFEEICRDFDNLLFHLQDKRWWTPSHEMALRKILHMEGGKDERGA